MKKIILTVLLIVLVITMSACGNKEYTNISNAELNEILASDETYQFVDVRTQEEYYDEHIPGFNINKDYYLFRTDYSMLDKLDSTIPTVIMCNSGNRSVDASEIFVELGFVEVYNLTDGIQGWNGDTTK
ncbi:MAG: rhodanese-like domain-containing protein [Candidatus Izimaplasma sp.]|nr:rhodanese-like domain-containing protein [Candidatus Izimaplasma bacterium]